MAWGDGHLARRRVVSRRARRPSAQFPTGETPIAPVGPRFSTTTQPPATALRRLGLELEAHRLDADETELREGVGFEAVVLIFAIFVFLSVVQRTFHLIHLTHLIAQSRKSEKFAGLGFVSQVNQANQ